MHTLRILICLAAALFVGLLIATTKSSPKMPPAKMEDYCYFKNPNSGEPGFIGGFGPCAFLDRYENA